MRKRKSKQTQPKLNDLGYKKLFSNRTIFQQLIESFITEAWVDELDFSQSETLDKSFITDHYMVYRTKAEVQTMLVEALEQERKKLYQDGEKAGVAEGQRRTLLQFLHWRFQTTDAEQTQIAQRLEQITDLQQLTQLGEQFLQAATLEEFTQQLAAYPPASAGNSG